MLKDKKGMTLGDIYPAVLTLVLIGIVLGLGLYIQSAVSASVATNYAGSDLNANTNGTTGTPYTTTLSDSTKTGYELASVTVISATCAGAITNFTYTTAGVITWGNSLYGNVNYTANITSVYTYSYPGSAEAVLNTSVTGLGDFADWIAIIVVIIAAAVVLGIVLSSFRRRPGV